MIKWLVNTAKMAENEGQSHGKMPEKTAASARCCRVKSVFSPKKIEKKSKKSKKNRKNPEKRLESLEKKSRCFETAKVPSLRDRDRDNTNWQYDLVAFEKSFKKGCGVLKVSIWQRLYAVIKCVVVSLGSIHLVRTQNFGLFWPPPPPSYAKWRHCY